ncbi:MAG TPA: YbaK/EbsC family protein [Bryobacteraceae bacterium]|jgi:prolyl-tRNA synthetase
MHWSKLFIPTLREDPAETAPASQRLLRRAGYLRGAGMYLYLGRRSLEKSAAIMREEMDAIGGQELQVPDGQDLMYLARELRSHKQLPQVWYQIQPRFEARSFDGTDGSHGRVLDAMRRIFHRCGVSHVAADAIAGTKFFALLPDGSDLVARAGGYAADPAAASGMAAAPVVLDPEGDLEPEEFFTPHRKTISEVAEFTGLPETSEIKSMVMAADGQLVLALLRGDHQLSEAKLAHALDVTELRPATPGEIRRHFGADAGSLGPVGVKHIAIIADKALRGRRNMIAGANKNDYHLRHVTPGEDFDAVFADLRQAVEGDRTPGGPLRFERAMELGQAVRLSPKRVENLGLHVTGEVGGEAVPHAGCYSIALDRILSAAAAFHCDADGLTLPSEIAPFELVITPVFIADEAQRRTASELYAAARAAGMDPLLDDRDERPGVKFKDADLIGIPYRITLGKKLASGVVEIAIRREKRSVDVPVEEAVEFVRNRLGGNSR